MARKIETILVASTAIALLFATSLIVDKHFGYVGVGAAQTADHGEGGQGSGGQGSGSGQGGEGSGQGGQGAGGQGAGGEGAGGEGAGGQGSGGQGSGGAGPGSDRGETDEGKGPRAGQGNDSGGGKPTWAQEGIPEVELGRLSVARSPDKVFERALAEVLATWNPALGDLYSMSADEFAAFVAANWDAVTIVDSPLQNLALVEALFDGSLNLTALGIAPESTLDLAAIFIGVASDKTLPISNDTIIALNVIMDLGLAPNQIAELAAKAEIVRTAVLEGHG